MLPDRVSNPGPLTYESGALPIALRGPHQPVMRISVVISLYLKVAAHPKLLISQSKFASPRKFTLR